MSVKHLFPECIAMLLAALAGCANPVVTGGDVEFKVYVTDESVSSLLRTRRGRIPTDAEMTGVISRSRVVRRFVVIPQYRKLREPRFFAAQAATSDKNRVVYPRRLMLATWQGKEHLLWDTSPLERSPLYAWVFAEGCWPVYIREGDAHHTAFMNGTILTRWSAWEKEAPPPGLEGTATAICFPLSRRWDREVAAAAGCRNFDYFFSKDDQIPSGVGNVLTLKAMSFVPCDLIVAVDQSKRLDDADRLMVFRHILRLYEHTKPHWTGPHPPDYGAAGRFGPNIPAYDKNTKLLRKRIATLEAKAAALPVHDAK